MDNIKTNNIISTPDITGNIGSCTSQSIKVPTEYNILAAHYETIVTNSCTGEVTTYPTWELGIVPFALSIFFLFFACIAIVAIADR